MKADDRKDPVEQLVRDCSAAEMVEWLVKYKHLHPNEAENVEINLREQFRWHRLQGRLDRCNTAAIIAELLLMRRSPMTLLSPKEKAEQAKA